MIIETILEKLARFAQYIYLPRFKRLEHEIGFRLVFHDIPDDYINGWMACEMTKTWQNFGLDIEKGANYFTMGSIVDDESTRFDPNSVEYQSWLGGYTVKLAPGANWTPEDHFKLAIADQNSWLRHYGDPRPMTRRVKGWGFTPMGKIQIGQYPGQLYEFGCETHDDIGKGYHSLKLWFISIWITAFFNLSNPELKLRGHEFRPRTSDNVYEKIKLLGYCACFDVAKNIKVVLYANGFIDERKHIDTFAILKDSLRKAMTSCAIVTV